jgi:anaerobic selenocysteine-containing dehydrogenase
MSLRRVNQPSVCPLDCPDTCSLSVTVENNQVTAVRGSRANPITGGAICGKVARDYPEFVHGPNRLRTPLRRTGAKGEAKFERVAWDDALDIIFDQVSAAIHRYGPQAVLPFNYAGPHGMLAGDSLSLRFFHRLGASLLDRRPLCGGIREQAYLSTFGPVAGMPLQQASLAKLVIVWGNNVTCCNLHLMPHINAAKRQGAKWVVIDPKRTRVAEQAHLHLPIRPGTDVVLAWAIASELEKLGGFDHDFIAEHIHGFEPFMDRARRLSLTEAAAVCDIPEEDIRQLAAWYKDSEPAAIAWGNGLERNQNGGSGLRAICALPALAGKFGTPGGGLIAAAGNAFPKTPARLTRPDLIPPDTRTLNILDVGRLILDDTLAPPLKALFMYNHNPVLTHPDQNRMKQALTRNDLFIVGIDVTKTDSLAYADVVLPACTHFEHADLYPAYGQQFLQRAEAVIPPVGESLPNTEIFRRLAARFGFDDPLFQASDTELMDEALDTADPRMQGINPSALDPARALKMTFEGEEPVLFENVFPKTASGKIELTSQYLDERYGQALPDFRPRVSDYPLALISPASNKRITSTFGGLKGGDVTPSLEMHPDDAQARGLSDGIRVRVWNEFGEVHLPLRITDAVRPGVVCSEKGAWFKTSDNGQTISALAPPHKADIAEGACFNDARVEVTAV